MSTHCLLTRKYFAGAYLGVIEIVLVRLPPLPTTMVLSIQIAKERFVGYCSV